MTLQEAIDLLSALTDLDLDLNVGSSPTDQQLCDCLSASAMRVYQDVGYVYTSVTLDLIAGDQQVALQDDTLSGSPQVSVNLFDIDEVRVGDVPITFLPWNAFNDPSAYGLTWRTADNGSPVAWTITPDLLLTFNCPFSIDAIATGGLGCSGRGCPRRFDASLVTSEWSEVHRLLQWAVIRGCVPYETDAYVDSPQAYSRLRLYDRNAEADMARFRSLVAHHDSPLDNMPGELRNGEVCF